MAYFILPGDEASKGATLTIINSSLTRNRQLNLLQLLMAPPKTAAEAAAPTGTASTWKNHDDTGASAIFKLFQARPQLLAKRIQKRPAAAASTSTSFAAAAAAASNDTKKGDLTTTTSTTIGGQKRRRM
jgi:hypothetical protein